MPQGRPLYALSSADRELIGQALVAEVERMLDPKTPRVGVERLTHALQLRNRFVACPNQQPSQRRSS